MSDKIKNLADALPEGLSDEVITEIASLLQGIIAERIEEEVGKLNTKVHAFLRQHMDRIQEAALNELNESSEVYRDAQILANIKAVMAFEVDREDVQYVADQVHEEVEKVQEDNSLLTSELASVLKEKEQAERALQILSDKNTSLTEETSKLQEQVSELEAESDDDFVSSEKAIIIKENEDEQENKTPARVGNTFLTDDVMALMTHNGEN
jgi:uncharacterized phage infection (PIP) family protein YhgE